MKYTVITGASSGIGYEIAKAFAGRGKNLILAARRKDLLEQLRAEILVSCPETDIIIKDTDLSVLKNVHQFYESLKGYPLETWINNAGIGSYSSVAEQDLTWTESLLALNINALTILSTLFVHHYKDVDGTQLINVSSCGGYTIVPNAVTYCASKFYVSAFTEGLAQELKAAHCKMKAKVLAPAATETGFGKTANHVSEYNYNKRFPVYHTSRQMAEFLLKLYDSDKTVGIVDRETFEFQLAEPCLPYAGNSAFNQK